MNREQLKAILWLRWRLTRNQFARGGQLNKALSIIITALLVTGAFVSAVGGFLAGISPLAKQSPTILMLVWDGIVFGFLVFWLSGLMIEIQRSESIDLTRLLHLPVTLRQVFVFNFLVSHVTPSIILLVPGMLTLCLGLALRAHPLMVLLIPALLGFVFMVTAWTYCLRGWLAALMTNKRRRRAIVLWMTVGFVLLSQVPNLVVQSTVGRRKHGQAQTGSAETTPADPVKERLPEGTLQAHLVLPPGWIGYSALALRESRPWPALGAAVAGGLLGVLGIMRAYRMTIRFYQGAESGARVKPDRPVRPQGVPSRLLVERHLPWLPEDTSALVLATLRSLLRAPELKMTMIMPLVASAGLVGVQFARPQAPLAEHKTSFVVTILGLMVVFLFAQMISNAFGLDRSGFRALVLAPIRRERILLAKNLALFPFVGVVAVVLLFLLKLYLRFSWTGLFMGLVQSATAFLLFCIGGNLLAIFAPYRMAAGTLQAKKPKAVVFLAVLASFIVLPLALLPLMIAPAAQLACTSLGWLPWLPVNLLAALVVLAGTAGLYYAFLPIEGRLLQRREQSILIEVTEETE